MDVEEVDVEIASIDVYWHGALTDGAQLNLLQYPLRPRWRPYDSALLQEVRVKPNSRVVEFDYALPKQDAIETNESTMKIERSGGEPVEDPSQREFETVRGTHAPMHSDYCIGLFVNKELHLHQVDRVFQLRPDFGHIDREDERRRSIARKNLPADQVNTEEEDFRMVNAEAAIAAANSAQLPLQVRRQESSKAKEIREKSWAHLKSQEEQEPWTTLEYTYPESHIARSLNERLLSVPNEVDFQFAEPREFLDTLTSETVQIDTAPAKTNEKLSPAPLTRDAIHRLPVSEQFQHFMRNTSVLPFSELLKMIKIAHPDDAKLPDPLTNRHAFEDELIQVLGKSGVLVRGVWVLRTSVMTHLSESFANIRNYLLLRYATDSEYLDRKAMSSTIPARPDVIKALLQPFCIHVKGKGWKLKYPPDTAFEREHPEHVKKYAHNWELNKKKLLAALQPSSTAPKAVAQASSSSAAKADVGIEDVVRDISGFITHTLNQYGVLNSMAIKQKLDEALKDGKKFSFTVLVPEHLRTFQKAFGMALAAVTDKHNTAHYLKSVADPLINTIRNAVLELFKVKNIYPVADFNAALAQKLGNRNIPQAKLDEVTRVFAHNKMGSWAFKVSASIALDDKPAS